MQQQPQPQPQPQYGGIGIFDFFKSKSKTTDQNIDDVESKEVDEVIIKLNPLLDDELLKSLINSTRQNIVNLYIDCQSDFVKGIELIEGIIAIQLQNTTEFQINNLNKATEKYILNK